MIKISNIGTMKRTGGIKGGALLGVMVKEVISMKVCWQKNERHGFERYLKI